MYILVDDFTEAVYPLGSTPLEAIVAFCDRVQKSGAYPHGIGSGLTKLFEQYVIDGTESELFTMVDRFSEDIKKAKCEPKGTSHPAFRLRRVPRPPCQQCRYWKGHGVYCETGLNKQSAWAPICSEWQPKELHWVDVEPIYEPTKFY